jgi:glyoxylase-like metal-dependent hydrolase (beta-lactamase superfamily II)
LKQLADGVWHLNAFVIPNAINAYLIEDVLVDAGTRQSAPKILKQLQGHQVNAHALTHAHPDHQGASHRLCEGLGVPFWVGEADADAAEDPELIRERQPDSAMARFYIRIFIGPGHPVDRVLNEGDEVAGFQVIDVPGHSAGHVAFWRDSDGVLILGDVLAKVLLDPRSGAKPGFGAKARGPGAEARAVRPRRADAGHEEVRRLRRGPALVVRPRPST